MSISDSTGSVAHCPGATRRRGADHTGQWGKCVCVFVCVYMCSDEREKRNSQPLLFVSHSSWCITFLSKHITQENSFCCRELRLQQDVAYWKNKECCLFWCATVSMLCVVWLFEIIFNICGSLWIQQLYRLPADIKLLPMMVWIYRNKNVLLI